MYSVRERNFLSTSDWIVHVSELRAARARGEILAFVTLCKKVAGCDIYQY